MKVRGWLATLAAISVLGASVEARRVTPQSIPATARTGFSQRGMASYYFGRSDRATVFVAAHRSLPFGTWVRVTNTRNGRSVNVKINDRGPFIAGRVIDVSNEAAAVLGMTRSGVASVTVQVLSRP